MDADASLDMLDVDVEASRRRSEEMTNAYEHGILLETEFRILELFPGRFDDDIHCELRNEPLLAEDGEEVISSYEALSYTWGAPHPKRQILCSGKVLYIGMNLYQALQHVRLKDKVRRIWADAICINQFDIPERNQHVQRMDRVFVGAERVLVWLGEKVDKEGDGVLNILPEWLGFYPPHIDWRAANIKWNPASPTFSFSPGGLSKESVEWLAYQQIHLIHMLHFWARRWFSRKWVIQEIVQAKEAIVLCGREEVKWSAISGLLNAPQDKFSLWHDSLARIFDHHPDKDFISNANNGIFNSKQLARMAANFSGQDALGLWDIVYETNDFKCSEPRDNLFSLFAIAADVRSGGESDLLHVDYSDPIGKISANYCLWLLTHDPYALICFRTIAGNRGCSRAVPSWTPNIVPATWLSRPDLRRPLSKLSYDAGRLVNNPKPTWNLISGNHIMSIKGVISETIKEIVPPPYLDISNTGWLLFGRGHASWFRECYKLVTSKVSNMQQALELMYLLLTCGGHEARFEDTGDWRSPSLEACRRWLDVIMDEGQEGEPDVYADPELSDMTTAVVFAKWRQFCTTSHGRFGWVPINTRVGDKVCVLHGGKVPFVISDCTKGHHNLMGEAYIHGIMRGEALDLGLPDQMIQLC